MRILVLLYIQKACNKMPPNHGFYCCWQREALLLGTQEDSRQHPNGGRQMRILVLLGIQKAPKERPPNRRFYCCWAPREGGIQRAPADLGRQRQK